MRRAHSFIAFSLIVIGAWIFPTQAGAAVCQNQTLVAYSNGIYNERSAAEFSLVKLEDRLSTYPQAASLLPFEYTLAYAANSNLFIDPATGEIRGPLGQLLEVTRQIRADRASVFWRWLAADPAAPQAFRDEQLRIAAQINLQAFTNDADLTGHLDGIYRSALTQGKRVLIVAHSQGNLYANAAYDSLFLEGLVGPSNSHMGIVAVASPASIVASTNSQDPHVTASEDLVILGVGKTYNGDPLPGTHSNFGDIATDDPLGHNFVKYYLAGAQTRVAILNHIVATIGGLQYAPQNCQQPVPWQKVLTHDWNSWSNIYGSLIRRIRDDANEWLFTAQYSISSQSVSIVLNAFDDSLSVTLPSYRLDSSYPYPLPQGILMPGSFLGFVPIPNGVGVWFETHIARAFTEVFPEDVQAAPAEIGDTFITLVSHVWDKASGAWATMPNTIQLPTYEMAVASFGLKTVAVSNYNCSGPTSALGHAPVQFDVNRSWVLCAGITNDLLIDGTYLNWAIVTIDSGVINASYNVTDIGGSYWSFLNPLQVDVPTGLYSSLYEALNPTSSSIKVGTVSLGASGWLAPLPRVGTRSILDQRIIGGGDSYISGQGVQSAPGYYEHHVLAIDSAVGLHNSVGQKHPTLLGGWSTQ